MCWFQDLCTAFAKLFALLYRKTNSVGVCANSTKQINWINCHAFVWRTGKIISSISVENISVEESLSDTSLNGDAYNGINIYWIGLMVGLLSADHIKPTSQLECSCITLGLSQRPHLRVLPEVCVVRLAICILMEMWPTSHGWGHPSHSQWSSCCGRRGLKLLCHVNPTYKPLLLFLLANAGRLGYFSTLVCVRLAIFAELSEPWRVSYLLLRMQIKVSMLDVTHGLHIYLSHHNFAVWWKTWISENPLFQQYEKNTFS